jgi:hypothetical protein
VTSGSPSFQRRKRGRHGWPLLFLILLALGVVYLALTPWALHIGDRPTPWLTWDGFGPVEATNGGHYVLFTHLVGGFPSGGRRTPACGMQTGCDTLHGTARLCTTGGQTYGFLLRGAVHGWWSTDGAATSIRLTADRSTPLQSGWVVSFAGAWNGPALELANTDNSFTKEFTPAGGIRRVTSTADAGTAKVTVRFGSDAEFERACQALTRHPG